MYVFLSRIVNKTKQMLHGTLIISRFYLANNVHGKKLWTILVQRTSY